MYRLLAILLVALPQPIEAGQADLSWTPPTQNEDGSPLIDLASYAIWHGCSQSGAYDTVEVVQAPATNHTVLNLPDIGTCYFAAKATNSAGESSVFSNESIKVIGTLAIPGLVLDTAVTWQESQAQPLVISNTQPSDYRWAILAEGELTYTDRSYTFVSVPAEMVGLDYLLTENSDKNSIGDSVVSFDVNKSVIVYVAYDRDFSEDSPPTHPAWLASWTNTGLFVTIRRSDSFHDVYSKQFPAGTVNLGGNNDIGAAVHSMYSVMVSE